MYLLILKWFKLIYYFQKLILRRSFSNVFSLWYVHEYIAYISSFQWQWSNNYHQDDRLYISYAVYIFHIIFGKFTVPLQLSYFFAETMCFVCLEVSINQGRSSGIWPYVYWSPGFSYMSAFARASSLLDGYVIVWFIILHVIYLLVVCVNVSASIFRSFTIH